MFVEKIVVAINFFLNFALAFPDWLESGMKAKRFEKYSRVNSIQSGFYG